MEEVVPTEHHKNSASKYFLPVGIFVLILIAAVTVYLTKAGKKTPITPQKTEVSQVEATPMISPESTSSQYADGEYSAVGKYVSPGGPREVNLTITLAGGVVTDTTFEGKAEDPTSKLFQGEFADNYKEMVIGKSIGELSLTKVAGSSLTPKGFNDALEKIKAEAQA